MGWSARIVGRSLCPPARLAASGGHRLQSSSASLEPGEARGEVAAKHLLAIMKDTLVAEDRASPCLARRRR